MSKKITEVRKSVTDGRTDGPTDGPTDRRTDTASYRDARTHLKMPPAPQPPAQMMPMHVIPTQEGGKSLHLQARSNGKIIRSTTYKCGDEASFLKKRR